MPVFISYRHSDRQKAFEVANILKLNNIRYYLDVIDDESRGTNDITEVITKNIKNVLIYLRLFLQILKVHGGYLLK